MCNLYRMRKSVSEIALTFGVKPTFGANFGEEVYPGYPGLVVAQGLAKVMTWGFPLVLTGKQGQKLKPKPVNNAREDKLHTAFWRDSFTKRRCLIPVSAWAEAEGERGRMTRTWHSLPHGEPFAVAGVWRATAEWGDAYSMVMANGCAQMAEIHDRMPVVLRPEEWPTWSDGEPATALALCKPCDDELLIDRTVEQWAKRNPAKLI